MCVCVCVCVLVYARVCVATEVNLLIQKGSQIISPRVRADVNGVLGIKGLIALYPAGF